MSKKDEAPEVRKIDVLRIRKSNTKNTLFENKEGKEFIKAARAQVKKSAIEDTPEWFIVWEIIEPDTEGGK